MTIGNAIVEAAIVTISIQFLGIVISCLKIDTVRLKIVYILGKQRVLVLSTTRNENIFIRIKTCK
jgi:hypothetical protein